jgi:hypothetical protein
MPPFNQNSPKPNATIEVPERSPMLPSWSPEAEFQKRDVTQARIAPAETSGEFTYVVDGSNPGQLERCQGGAFLDSDFLIDPTRGGKSTYVR